MAGVVYVSAMPRVVSRGVAVPTLTCMAAMPRVVTCGAAVPTVTCMVLMGGVYRVATCGVAVPALTCMGCCGLTVLSLLIPARLLLHSRLVRLV